MPTLRLAILVVLVFAGTIDLAHACQDLRTPAHWEAEAVFGYVVLGLVALSLGLAIKVSPAFYLPVAVIPCVFLLAAVKAICVFEAEFLAILHEAYSIITVVMLVAILAALIGQQIRNRRTQ